MSTSGGGWKLAGGTNLHRGGTPVSEEVGWDRPWPHNAAHVVPLINRAPHYLTAQSASTPNDKDTGFRNGRALESSA